MPLYPPAGGGPVGPTAPYPFLAATWAYDASSTTMANPGAGLLRLNNAALASATAAAISTTGASSEAVAQLLANLTNADRLVIADETTGTGYARISVTSIAVNTGWVQVNFTVSESSGSIAGGDTFGIFVDPAAAGSYVNAAADTPASSEGSVGQYAITPGADAPVAIWGPKGAAAWPSKAISVFPKIPAALYAAPALVPSWYCANQNTTLANVNTTNFSALAGLGFASLAGGVTCAAVTDGFDAACIGRPTTWGGQFPALQQAQCVLGALPTEATGTAGVSIGQGSAAPIGPAAFVNNANALAVGYAGGGGPSTIATAGAGLAAVGDNIVLTREGQRIIAELYDGTTGILKAAITFLNVSGFSPFFAVSPAFFLSKTITGAITNFSAIS